MGILDRLKNSFSNEKEKEVIKEDLDKGLEKSNKSIFDKFSKAIAGKSKVDEELLDTIEEILISSDVSLDTTIKIIERLEAKVAKEKYLDGAEIYAMVKAVIVDILSEASEENQQEFEIPDTGGTPYVLLVVGVNGAGKTTTIGKLANRYKLDGKKVLLGAADTFRAAAIEQLTDWATRIEVPLVKTHMGADPAAVAYQTVEKAVNEGFDVAIIDTAGRLHNKINLMNELSKIKRVMQKFLPDAPHDVMLVLDGSTGQNALEQAKHFTAATDVSCLTITKLDGTAKGGVVVGISDQFKIPIKFIGVGEMLHHLQPFDKKSYVDSLFRDVQ